MGGTGGGQPRQLFPANSPGAQAGIGGAAGASPGMGGFFQQMMPGIMASMQQGNFNPMFQQAIASALSGGFQQGGGMRNQMMPLREPAPFPPGQRPPGNNWTGPAPVAPQPAPQPGGFRTAPVAPVQPKPVSLPAGQTGYKPLFPPKPGGGNPIRAPEQPKKPAAPGNANAAEIFHLRQQLQNPDQSAPMALLMARRRLAELGG